MSENKATVERYLQGFTESDHDKVLSCLTDDVVVVEGSVRAKRADGGSLNAVFCDVFVMKNTKIQKLITYLMQLQ